MRERSERETAHTWVDDSEDNDVSCCAGVAQTIMGMSSSQTEFDDAVIDPDPRPSRIIRVSPENS